MSSPDRTLGCPLMVLPLAVLSLPASLSQGAPAAPIGEEGLIFRRPTSRRPQSQRRRTADAHIPDHWRSARRRRAVMHGPGCPGRAADSHKRARLFALLLAPANAQSAGRWVVGALSMNRPYELSHHACQSSPVMKHPAGLGPSGATPTCQRRDGTVHQRPSQPRRRAIGLGRTVGCCIMAHYSLAACCVAL